MINSLVMNLLEIIRLGSQSSYGKVNPVNRRLI